MPLFSIIIPCYNCKNTISATLNSIVNQHLKDKIEVILVDDCSSESFQNEVDCFKDKLIIKEIRNNSNLGVGMTRQKGLDAAEGEWIVFCDNDDTFIPNSFNKIRTIIRNNPSRNIIQARFQETFENNQEPIPYSFERGTNWIHAKFFRRSFLEKYNLCFKEGLETHEDIYFSILTRLATNHINSPVLNCNLIIYNWYNRPTSLSHSRETGLDLFENHFQDYIDSAFAPIVKLKDLLTKNEKISQCLSVILFVYFYSQGFLNLKRGHHERDLKLLTGIVLETVNITGLSLEQIVQTIYSNANIYCSIRNKSFDSVGFFIEKDDLKQIILNAEDNHGQ